VDVSKIKSYIENANVTCKTDVSVRQNTVVKSTVVSTFVDMVTVHIIYTNKIN